MTSWAHSGGYGSPVVLGPTQKLVYTFVLRATAHERRPEFTLAEIAGAIGKPVSSVHEALGRLRALGLIGVAARMGRTGGHRLWRVASRVSGALDVARHRRAVARVIKRWYAFPVVARTAQDVGTKSESLWSDRPGVAGPVHRPDSSQDDPSGRAAIGASGLTLPGRSFRELIGLEHRLPWEREDLQHETATNTD